MLDYLLKSGVCLAVFYLFYKLLLEKEPIHIFKRIYLLSGLVLAFAIPLITFTTVVEIDPVEFIPYSFSEIPFEQQITQEVSTINYWPIILWTVYGFGIVVFSLKFLLNLYKIGSKIRKNTKQKVNQFTHVLLQNLSTPHTFLSYIFLNKQRYLQHQIPQEVFWHEETHAKQKHSFDVVFLELLQVVFWFNPLLYFIKKDIKLNHEFLADSAVLNKGVSLTVYQEILLAFSSNQTEPLPNNVGIANALNYSSIKKRFTIMKTQPSKKAVWIKSLILLPLVAVLIYGFSEKVEVQIEKTPTNINSFTKTISITIKMDVKGKILVNDKTCNIEDLSKKLNNITQEISDEQKREIVINLKTDTNTPETSILFAKEFIRISGFTKISFNNYGNIENLKQGYSGPKFYRMVFYLDDDNQILVHGNWINLLNLQKELNKHHNVKNESLSEIELVVRNGTPKNTLSKTKTILNLYGNLKVKFTDSEAWGSVNPKQKNNPNISTSVIQHNATPQEIAEYNKLAREYNAIPTDKMIVKQKDLNRINYIYKKMTEKQKKDVEPFPDFKFPPPLPQPLKKSFNSIYSQPKTTIINNNQTGNYPIGFYFRKTDGAIIVSIPNKKMVEAVKKKKLKSYLQDLIKEATLKPEKIDATINIEKWVEKNRVSSVENILKSVKIIKINKKDYVRPIPDPNIPPPPPAPSQKTIEKGSKELQEAFKKFSIEGELYAKAVQKYKADKKGLDNIIDQFKEVMKLHKVYTELATEEGVLPTPPPPPPPASSQKTIEKGSKELQEAFKKFSIEGELYAKSLQKYKADKKGLDNIIDQFKEVMKLHKAYREQATEEGVLPTPPPPPPPAKN